MSANPNIPAMYVDWITNGNFEKIIVDWRCDINHVNRYWSVHNFVYGYAGFQNNDVYGKITNFTIWNQGDVPAKLEYCSENANYQYFTTEGVGCRIFKNISWVSSTWYKMCIGVKTVADRTYFAQWYKNSSLSSSQWELIGVISLKTANMVLPTSTVFQEDWAFDGGIAAFSIGGGYGQDASSHNWSPFKSGNVISIFSNGDRDINKNCFYEKRNSTFPYMYIKSGLGVTPPTGSKLPYNFNLNEMSNTPTNYPEWDFVCKKSIRNVNSKLYIATGSGNTVVQKNSVNGVAHEWRIKFAENGYFYILSENSNMAITVQNFDCGADLLLQSLQVGNDYQKWKFEGDSTNGFYIVPKSSGTMTMDVENASYLDNAPIQLWTQVSTAPQMKWQILSSDEIN